MMDVLVETTRVSERGQVVIPKDIRDRLGLNVGSKLVVLATEDTIILQKAEVLAQSVRSKDIIERALNLIRKMGLRV